jgi:hypothetical protein
MYAKSESKYYMVANIDDLLGSLMVVFLVINFEIDTSSCSGTPTLKTPFTAKPYFPMNMFNSAQYAYIHDLKYDTIIQGFLIVGHSKGIGSQTIIQTNANYNGFAIATKLSEIDATVFGELVLPNWEQNNLSDNIRLDAFS